MQIFVKLIFLLVLVLAHDAIPLTDLPSPLSAPTSALDMIYTNPILFILDVSFWVLAYDFIVNDNYDRTTEAKKEKLLKYVFTIFLICIGTIAYAMLIELSMDFGRLARRWYDHVGS